MDLRPGRSWFWRSVGSGFGDSGFRDSGFRVSGLEVSGLEDSGLEDSGFEDRQSEALTGPSFGEVRFDCTRTGSLLSWPGSI